MNNKANTTSAQYISSLKLRLLDIEKERKINKKEWSVWQRELDKAEKQESALVAIKDCFILLLFFNSYLILYFRPTIVQLSMAIIVYLLIYHLLGQEIEYKKKVKSVSVCKGVEHNYIEQGLFREAVDIQDFIKVFTSHE